MAAIVYLLPTVLAEGRTDCLPAYLLTAIRQCQVLFVEQERTARRYLKLLQKEIDINAFDWYNMKDITEAVRQQFRQQLQEGKTVGLISEAGCPGVADPGQQLVAIAQQMKVTVKPFVGPNSILLALMGSGMNGQQFQFCGYLPIEAGLRAKALKSLEAESKHKNCTQLFIETPYRNDQLLETLLKTCAPTTQVCLAVDLTDSTEWIRTCTVAEWKKETVVLHKRLVIFLLYAGV